MIKRNSIRLGLIIGALIICAAGTLAACAAISPGGPVGNANVPEPVSPVTLSKYMGEWFEIARYENGFEEGCEGVTANYSLRWDGRVDVTNTCHEGSADGPVRAQEGVARLAPDDVKNNKLKVSFWGPFTGDYWVMDHGPDYQWAIVGEPSGRYLWLLTRMPQPSERNVAFLYNRAQELGYNTDLLRRTAQLP